MKEAVFLKHIRIFLPVFLVLIGLSFLFDKTIADWARTLPASTVNVFKIIEILCATMPHLVLWPVAFFVLFALYKKQKTAQPFLVFTVAIAFSYLLCYLLKIFFSRARPELLFSNQMYGFFFFSTDFGYQAFPSGHSTTIAAVAAISACYFPRYSPAFLSVALFMAFSRVATGAHFLSDVFAGVLLGTLSAQWVYVKLKFRYT